MLRKKFSGRLAGKVNEYGGFSRSHGDQPPQKSLKICDTDTLTPTNRPRKRKRSPIWVIGQKHNRFKTKHIQNACMVLNP